MSNNSLFYILVALSSLPSSYTAQVQSVKHNHHYADTSFTTNMLLNNLVGNRTTHYPSQKEEPNIFKYQHNSELPKLISEQVLVHKSSDEKSYLSFAQQNIKHKEIVNSTSKMLTSLMNPIAEALIPATSSLITQSNYQHQELPANNSSISSTIYASDTTNTPPSSTSSFSSLATNTLVSSTTEHSTVNYNGLNATDPYAFTTESRAPFSLPIEIQILMCLFYGTLAFTAVTSNMIVCYIVLSNQQLRTATNYFIVNLAVGDILMALLCIPFTFPANLIFNYWPFGWTLCVIVSYSQAISVFVSAYTMVAISIDKYLAIMYPMRLRMSKTQAKIIILVIWSAALLTSLPTALLSSLVSSSPESITTTTISVNAPTSQTNAQSSQSTLTNSSILAQQTSNTLLSLTTTKTSMPLNSDDSTLAPQQQLLQQSQEQLLQQKQEQIKYFCQESWNFWPAGHFYYSMALMILQFVLPLFVLVITYSRIVIVVWAKRMPGEEDNARDARMARSKRKMIKMVIFCVIAFALTWLPFNALIVIGDLDPVIWEHQQITYIWFITHYLAMCHTITNPLIYIWMNNRFRAGFKQVFEDFIRPIKRLFVFVWCYCCCFGCALDCSRKKYFRVASNMNRKSLAGSSSRQVTGSGSLNPMQSQRSRHSLAGPQLSTPTFGTNLGESATSATERAERTSFSIGARSAALLDKQSAPNGRRLMDSELLNNQVSNGNCDRSELKRVTMQLEEKNLEGAIEASGTTIQKRGDQEELERKVDVVRRCEKGMAASNGCSELLDCSKADCKKKRRKRQANVISIQMTSIEYRDPRCLKAIQNKQQQLENNDNNCGRAKRKAKSKNKANCADSFTNETNIEPNVDQFVVDVRQSSQTSTCTNSVQTNTTSVPITPLNSARHNNSISFSFSSGPAPVPKRSGPTSQPDLKRASERADVRFGGQNGRKFSGKCKRSQLSTTSGSLSSDQIYCDQLQANCTTTNSEPKANLFKADASRQSLGKPISVAVGANEDNLETDEDVCDVFQVLASSNSTSNGISNGNKRVLIKTKSNGSLELLSDQFDEPEDDSLNAEYGDESEWPLRKTPDTFKMVRLNNNKQANKLFRSIDDSLFGEEASLKKDGNKRLVSGLSAAKSSCQRGSSIKQTSGDRLSNISGSSKEQKSCGHGEVGESRVSVESETDGGALEARRDQEQFCNRVCLENELEISGAANQSSSAPASMTNSAPHCELPAKKRLNGALSPSVNLASHHKALCSSLSSASGSTSSSSSSIGPSRQRLAHQLAEQSALAGQAALSGAGGAPDGEGVAGAGQQQQPRAQTTLFVRKSPTVYLINKQ